MVILGGWIILFFGSDAVTVCFGFMLHQVVEQWDANRLISSRLSKADKGGIASLRAVQKEDFLHRLARLHLVCTNSSIHLITNPGLEAGLVDWVQSWKTWSHTVYCTTLRGSQATRLEEANDKKQIKLSLYLVKTGLCWVSHSIIQPSPPHTHYQQLKSKHQRRQSGGFGAIATIL